MKSEFETWPATPVEASLAINEVTLPYGLVGVLLSNKRSSRGRPAIQDEFRIADFGLRIYKPKVDSSAIGSFTPENSSMSCEETTELLSQFIDDVLPEPLRVTVDEHLDRCPVCRAHAAELRSLSRSLRQLSRPVAPVELASSINDALMIEAAAAASRLTFPWWNASACGLNRA
jgi:hypothetical protein